MAKKALYHGIVGSGIAVLLAISMVRLSASQATSAAIPIDADDLGGVVTSTTGPEAGVWVIAETTDLPTKFVRIVVTDDRGRYVLPDLPKANYAVWVRGYGLVDSPKVQGTLGKLLNLTAVVASNPREAAQYYPSNYWWSMLQVPAKSEFPGTGAKGNGISENVKSQAQWMMRLRTEGCLGCHLMGTKATREIPASLGTFASTVAAWDRRIQSGQNGAGMSAQLNNLGRQRVLAMLADWTDRVKAGELPPAPPRPQGRERNLVISMWDWADPKAYLHDEVTSDKRNPRVNANGPVYGSLEAAADYLSVVDPNRHTATRLPLQLRNPNTPPVPEFMPQPSPYWGEEPIWTSRTSAHSFAMDEHGRVWTAQKIRPNETPEFCRPGSSHPSAKLFPINESGRQVSVYDPRTKQFTLVDLCFATHHLAFAEDANDTLWFCSGGGEVVGWLNTKVFDETKDEAKAQGWTAFILDTNGNGKRDAYVEPNQPIDPTKDKRIISPFYGVIPSPVDGSIWGSVLGFPGSIVRLNLGSNPPA
ncbi:MAG TPA: carboxypeptidase-like regulatory domain-containing protein, partial [Gemmatimonadales bacterium]|nr:carboxypeptidase-like regulatory domain-containing protein [Gemmatimonadales bacterium]